MPEGVRSRGGLGVILALLPEAHVFTRVSRPFGIRGNSRGRFEPRLRLAQPLVSYGSQVIRLIKRPGLHNNDVGVLHWRAPKSSATGGTHLTRLDPAIGEAG